MSESYLVVIPRDRTWVPSAGVADRARDKLAILAPASDEVSWATTDQVEFVGSGNWEGVACPACGVEIELAWWQAAMDASYETSHFAETAVVTPCCGSATTLDDLDYRGPWVGFARWTLAARSYKRDRLTDDECQRLAAVLDVPVRVVYQHV